MSRITSKLQVTLPKTLADSHRLHPGDEIDWQDAGDTIRVVPRRNAHVRVSPESRLNLFDHATERQHRRQSSRLAKKVGARGWTREELYRSGRPD